MCTTLKTTWWLLLLVLVVFGAVGGIARHLIHGYMSAQENGPRTTPLRPSVIVGAIAGLVVPLFLNASSSSLVQSILDGSASADRDWFFLLGYCVLAGFVGNMFLSSMASKSLKLSQEANQLARQSAVQADAASRAADQARRLIEPIVKIDRGRIDEAIRELEAIVLDDPRNAEAFAYLAYAKKRQDPPQLEDAIRYIRLALALETPQPFSWLYNLSCYLAVRGDDEDKVLSVLGDALARATAQERQVLAKDLLDDPDFANLRKRNQDSAFWVFLRNVKGDKNGS